MEPHSFALEQLEGRALFSVAAPVGAGPVLARTAVLAATIATTTPLVGAFNVAGTYTQPPANPDTGTHYLFNGAGTKKSLRGNFTLTGNIAGPGFVANGHAMGYLTITASRGTIVLKVLGPPQSPGSLPPSLTFRIVNGTGSYAHVTGKGHIVVAASSRTHKFLFKFNPVTT